MSLITIPITSFNFIFVENLSIKLFNDTTFSILNILNKDFIKAFNVTLTFDLLPSNSIFIICLSSLMTL